MAIPGVLLVLLVLGGGGFEAAAAPGKETAQSDHSAGLQLGHARPYIMAAVLGPSRVQELVAEVCASGGAAVPKRVVRHVNALIQGAQLTQDRVEQVAAKVHQSLGRADLVGVSQSDVEGATARTFASMKGAGGVDRRDIGRLCNLSLDPSGAFVHRLASRGGMVDR